jgi:hypothetical protein
MITRRLLDDPELLFLKRPEVERVGEDPAIATRVSEILRDLERGGEDALRRYARELDGWDGASFELTRGEIEAAEALVPETLREHLQRSRERTEAFARAQRGTLSDLEVEVAPGVIAGHRLVPVSSVGAYLPAGRVPLLASPFMTVLVPKVAGVETVVACAPPQRGGGGIHPSLVYSTAICGADRIFALGGVQALATRPPGADAVRPHRPQRGGVASFGLPRNAELYALTDLAAEMSARHPLVGMRLIGQNSVEVADAIRAGALEAGLVVLPVDDEGLDIEPVIRDEVLYATADAARAAAPMATETMLTQRLVLSDAHYGNADPTRRQLNERLQQLGGRLEPHFEVEYLAGALRLAAGGAGDTIVARAAAESELMPEGLYTTTFAEPLYDTLAVLKPRDRPLAPATRELLAIALERLAAFERRRGVSRPARTDDPGAPRAIRRA